MGPEEYDFATIILIVKDILNGISLIAALSVTVLILGSMAIDRKSMDRVSIRITLVIAILDFMYAAINICFAEGVPKGLGCILSDMLAQWLSLSYLFLNTSIAVNLHLIFVCGYASNPIWETAYWAVSFGLSTILSTIPLAGYYFDIKDMHTCMEGDIASQHLWLWGVCFMWILGTIVYCSIVVVMVIYKLIKNERELKRSCTKSEAWQSARFNAVIKSLIRRITLYCLIPVITQTGYLVSELNVDDGISSKPMYAILVVSMALPGTVNFFAFLIDPAFSKAILTFKTQHLHRKIFALNFRKCIATKNQRKHRPLEVVKPIFHELEPTTPTLSTISGTNLRNFNPNKSNPEAIISGIMEIQPMSLEKQSLTHTSRHHSHLLRLEYGSPPIQTPAYPQHMEDTNSSFENNVHENRALVYMKSL